MKFNKEDYIYYVAVLSLLLIGICTYATLIVILLYDKWTR
jgi:hypothetical protein